MKTTSISIIKKLLLVWLVVAGLHYAKAFLMPLVTGGILATLFLPFCHWLERKKLPKGLAVFACLLILVLIIVSLFSLLGWKIADLMKDVELTREKAMETFARVQQYIFNHAGVSAEKQSQIIKAEQPSITRIMQTTVGSVSYVFSNLTLVFVYFIFLLYSRVHLKTFLFKLAAPTQKAAMEQVIKSTTQVSQQYLLGLSKMIVCLWIMYGIGFSIIGVKNALFFAILCGLLEVIPYVGNLVGTTLTVSVAAFHGADVTMLIGIVSTYAVVQLIQGWILEPLMLGSQVKLNALFTIIALVLGGLVWGIPGIILAIPVTAMFKIICDHIEPLKPYGFLMGKMETGEVKNGFIRKIKSRFRSDV